MDEKTENYVVYKNKYDGSRAVRYEGKDEAYAVNEIYQKLKEEILNQKQRISAEQNANRNTSRNLRSNTYGTRKKHVIVKTWLIFAGLIFCNFILFAAIDKTLSRGYYKYPNNTYHYQLSVG